MRRVPGQEPLGAYGAQPFQRVGPPNADPAGLSGIYVKLATTSTCATGFKLTVGTLLSSPTRTFHSWKPTWTTRRRFWES